MSATLGRTSDTNEEIREGDLLFTHYDMAWGMVGEEGHDGWFRFHLFEGGYSSFNGQRVCSQKPRSQNFGQNMDSIQPGLENAWDTWEAFWRPLKVPQYNFGETFLGSPLLPRGYDSEALGFEKEVNDLVNFEGVPVLKALTFVSVKTARLEGK